MMAPTMLETMVKTREPSTDHQKPCTKTPTPKRLTASQLARRINSQLIIKVTNPSERIANGNDTKCTIGLMEALINAMNKANAAMPRIGGSPTGVMPGITATITAAAMVIISQLVKKLLMDLS